MTAMPNPRAVTLGVLARLQALIPILAPILAVMWLFNIHIPAGTRALAVLAALLGLIVDSILNGPPTTIRFRPGGAR